MQHVKVKLRFCTILAALVLSFGGLAKATGVQADSTPDRLASLTVSVWLEYDRPGALYIYQGDLPAGTPLPARLTFRLPKEPSSTAGIDAGGTYHYVRPDISQDGQDVVVSYQTNWPSFQLEYYDDVLRSQGPVRELDFRYRADYAVEQLSLAVKEPYAASAFTLDPVADGQSQGEDGLTEHRRNLGPVAPGQELSWKITYTKNDPRLAAQALGLPTPAATQYESLGDTAARPTGKPAGTSMVLALGALVGLAAVGGLGLAFRSNSRRWASAPTAATGRASSAAGGAKGSRRRKKGAAPPAAPRVRTARYCFQCGASLARGDAFCPKCGARRRGT